MRTAIFALLLVSSCSVASDPRNAASPNGAVGPTTSTTSADPADVRANAPPRVEVVRSEGLTPARLDAMSSAARRSLQHCPATNGGALVVALSSDAQGLHVTVAPGTSLDPTARSCAVEALTRTFGTETASNVGGPAVPPTGFTSLLTIRW